MLIFTLQSDLKIFNITSGTLTVSLHSANRYNARIMMIFRLNWNCISGFLTGLAIKMDSGVERVFLIFIDY